MKMRLPALIVSLLITGSASATTITFDEIVDPFFSYTELDSNGYHFSTADSFQIAGGGGDNFIGLYPFAPLVMEQLGGGDFTLNTVDLSSNAGNTVDITGYLSAGGTVQESITFAQDGFQTFLLDSSWQGLETVEFFGYVAVDNIVVTAVPVPAATWLFGSALIGLAGLRRTRKPAA